MSEIVEMEEHVVTEYDRMGAMIERVASVPDSDVSKLQALLDMQMTIMKEEQRQAYLRDFSTMQAELPAIRKSAETQQSKYAQLEYILEAAKPVLAKWGFSLSFIPKTTDGYLTIKAVLQQNGGHVTETEINLPFDTSGNKNSVQAIGSTMTYGMRYTAVALLAISTFDGENPADLDGTLTITEEEAIEVRDYCNENNQDESRLCVYFTKYYKIPIGEFEDLPVGSVKTVKGQIDSVVGMKR